MKFCKRFSIVLFLTTLLVTSLILLSFGQPVLAQSATFQLYPSVADLKQNESVDVQLLVNSPEAQINTIHAEITFPAEAVDLKNIDFTGSLFPNIVEKDTSQAGTVKITSFTITPFQGENGLVTILTFTAKRATNALFDIQNTSSVHMADGTGANILNFPGTQQNLNDNLPPEKITTSTAVDENPETGGQTSRTKPLATVTVDSEPEVIEGEVVDYTANAKTEAQKTINRLTNTEGEKSLLTNILFWVMLVVVALLVGLGGGWLFFKNKQKRQNEI